MEQDVKAQHTPGPWEAEESAGRGSWVGNPAGSWAALACGETDAEAESNARLISAAPELLEALEPFAALFVRADEHDDEPLFPGTGIRLTKGDVRRARAAIAKAKGESAPRTASDLPDQSEEVV